MKAIITLLTIICFNITLMAQKNLKPEIGIKKDISETAMKEYQKVRDKLQKIQNELENSQSDELSKEDNDFLMAHEMDMAPNSTDVAGCSWYCAAIIDEVKASSILENSENYLAWNVHDFDLSKTWATNKNKGIGESITFTFGTNDALSINQIQIYNGYQKSETAWKNNSRAKKIALSINGKHYADLELLDVRNVQNFIIDSQKFMTDKNLIFEFKILEIYPGDKYKDLCISEINFDGEGDH